MLPKQAPFPDGDFVVVVQRDAFWTDFEWDHEASFATQSEKYPDLVVPARGWGFRVPRAVYDAAWAAAAARLRPAPAAVAPRASLSPPKAKAAPAPRSPAAAVSPLPHKGQVRGATTTPSLDKRARVATAGAPATPSPGKRAKVAMAGSPSLLAYFAPA